LRVLPSGTWDIEALSAAVVTTAAAANHDSGRQPTLLLAGVGGCRSLSHDSAQ
jgi:hypothetical protein